MATPSTTSETNHSQQENKKETLLIVDDDRLILAALEETFRREGYPLLLASSGAEALELLKTHQVALILCDQRMPGMLGTETLQKAQEIQPNTIRILLTGNGDLETAIQAINVGRVHQFLTKPWDDSQIRQTIRLWLKQWNLARTNEKLQLEITRSHAAMQKQLYLGAQIHEQLLLGKVPKDIPGMDVAAMTLPSLEIDGDFYDFYRPQPSLFDLVIGDVMGKGLPAALVGTAVKTQLTRFALPAISMLVFDKKKQIGKKAL